MFVRRHTFLLSLNTTAVKSPLVLTRMSPHFNLSVLGLRSLGIPFLCSLTVPQQKIFFWTKSSYRSGEEKIVHVQFMAKSFYNPCQVSHCIVCCCQVLCRSLSVFAEVNIHVTCISSRVTSFEYFDAEMFTSFRDVLLENYPSLEFHNDIYCQMFGRVVKF